ncbi:WXG100 family type VII secretion target [Paenibacillus alginolyticus]|uniref:ESAT-6-like protein n=1 Tax=Paenibacillus alginolyticus TaxID=59839 RepID=A0ABT4G7E7_9BACL|nr:WXG100 family type VII secretion target [Paenibacillus alginolyticus]MCY9692058.1 WXG100 family type VII secretion target [Paenibacillus alginolyticus]MEC0144248.1 WXG100 family type VII secretion target [Paenibacillus alginolyticus]
MARKIVVEPEVLERTATSMESKAGEYKQQYDQLFNEVKAMGAAWKGADNLAFTEQIEGFRPEFEEMFALINDYNTFLRSSSKIYRDTQTETINAAKRLTN